MKHFKRSAALLFILVFAFMSFGMVAAQKADIKVPNPTAEFYSNDFAEILNSSTERNIVALGESTFKATEGGQVVFVSIDTLNGNSIEEYANTLFNKWKIGTKDKGILIILSMQERESRIEVGYGYEGVLTDIQSNKLLDKLAELNQEKGIDEAVETVYRDICSIIGGNGAAVEYPADSHGSAESNFFSENPILTVLLVIIVIILIVLDFIFTGGQVTFFVLRMMAASARKGGGGGGGRNSGGGGRSGGGGASSRF